jgi:Dolichyl-phosphate-mannose-protein mannosyltransferase
VVARGPKIDRLPRLLIYLLVATLCSAALAAAHGSRIVANWHVPQWEDGIFFWYNQTHIHSLWDCFAKQGLWPGLYRPLTTNLYFYLGRTLLGNRIEAYHFINLVFVILNAILLYRLAESFLGRWWAIVPAILFSSRLAFVEVVLHACEFQGLLYTFFTILSADFFIRSRRSESARLLTLSAIAFCLALFSKESAIVLPAILIAYGRLFDDRIVGRPYLVHPIIALLWVILFVSVLRPHFNNDPTGFTYDFSIANLMRNYAAYGMVFSNYLLAPLNDFVMPNYIGGIDATMPARIVCAALIIVEAAVLLFPGFLKSQDLRLVAFGFGWFLIATAPFAIFAGRLFMRYSYLGHAGLALCVGGLLRGAVGLFRTRQPVDLPHPGAVSLNA